MLVRATQDKLVTGDSVDKMRYTGGENSKPLQHSRRENPMHRMNTETDMMPEGEPPGWKVSNMLLGKSERQQPAAPERMKQLGQSGNDTQL